MTRRQIFFFCSQINDRTLKRGTSIQEFQIENRLFVAEGTGCFYLLNGVSQLQQPFRTFKEFRAEIGTKPITNHRNIKISGKRTQLVDTMGERN